MKCTKRRPVKKRVIRSWKQARLLLEAWRKKLTNLQVELKRPRAIDAVPVDFLRDEPPEREGKPTQKFRGQLIFFTKEDVTIRRSSGAILVIDSYEIAAISGGKTRFEVQ
ncbi:MAG TPA: hypothetical protein VJK29_14905 [Terriglobales bacterium]|nr:hypothetical protein [Terriglobales bacterium]